MGVLISLAREHPFTGVVFQSSPMGVAKEDNNGHVRQSSFYGGGQANSTANRKSQIRNFLGSFRYRKFANFLGLC
jgi:hypothetical protein